MVELRPATDQDVRQFASWHYDPPYDVYDIDMTPDEAVVHFLEPGTDCHTLFDGNVMVGYCTFGHDAQVPGGDYDSDGIDIGLGVKPELTGDGNGNRFVEAFVSHALATFDPPQLRVTIAAGNTRALRVWSDAGFSEVSRFAAARDIMGSGEFAILALTPTDHPRRSTGSAATSSAPWSVNPDMVLIGESRLDPIRIVEYDTAWPVLYTDWHDRLLQVVPSAIRVDHVGSTAVPGLAAKPIIDIQMSVSDIEDEQAFVPGIESTGVHLRMREPGHCYFRPPPGQPRDVQIHACNSGSEWEIDHLLFRDYLREHPKARDAYASLKLELAAQHQHDRIAYTEAKSDFIARALDAARRP